MKRVCILCEGTTEKEFVQSCLYPFLLKKGVSVWAENLGGDIKPQKVASFVRKHYASYDFISTLLDFYGFKQHSAVDKASLEQEIMQTVSQVFHNTDPAAKFRPYVQMYEFEGLLFSDVSQFEWVSPDEWGNGRHLGQLQAIYNAFATPEMINNSRETAPSKRLNAIFQGTYDKVQHGVVVAESIGLERIREKCPHFNDWLSWLESLGRGE